ncbi:MAG: lysophospholipid acyltransferase family protein [Rhodobiaceae bacterium]|nr:lysophospholipid acyltransferase family protein [Rhodobiaceae bacterium]MCC0054861.1 lysophospholipid acyltransferase family protein [Rhodobiaceae bacterium]
MTSIKRFGAKPGVQRFLGRTIALYLKFVDRTTRYTIEPADIYDRVDRDSPAIIAMWHGEHFMMPFVNRRNYVIKALISRHRDGEINAIAAEAMGIGTVRGSGDHSGRYLEKGGVGAFRAMLDELELGTHIALTADVPKVAKRAGMGIVKLASRSGRPIIPAVIATHRRITFDNWDKSKLNLPFSKGAMVAGEWVHVPADADDETLERCRRQVEDNLNAAMKRAYEIVDG